MRKQSPQIDLNDLAYVEARHGLVVESSPCPQDKLTGKINPHVSRFKVLGGEEEVVSVFHVKPVYYEHASSTDADLVFRPMYEVCEHYGNKLVVFKYEKMLEVNPRFVDWLRKRMTLIGGQVLITSPFQSQPTPFGYTQELVHKTIVKPTIGLTTTTVYPDPDPETTTVDGFITSGYKSTMQLMHDTVTGDGASPTSPYTPKYTILRTLRNASGYYGGRTVFLFDTSSIPDTDTISSATLSVYGTTNNYVNANSTSYNVVATNPASNTNLVAADFGTFSFTAFATINFASLSQSAYNDFTLNASGIAAVSKTGVSKYGGITGQDLNVAAQSSGQDNIFCGMEADESGTTSDPKLAVVHVPPSTPQSLTANISAAADIATVSSFHVALVTAIAASTFVKKGFIRTLVASITTAASMATQSINTVLMSATVSAAATINKTSTFVRTMTGSIATTATVTNIKSFYRTLAAAVNATASVGATKTFYQILTAAVSAAASMTNGGAIRTTIVAAAIAVAAKIQILFYKRKYTDEDEDYKRKY